MAKKVQAMVKLQITAGKANPSPPVGPALGQHGVNIMEFCKGFNAQTNSQEGLILPVVVTIFQDRSFTFVVKTPPAAILLKRAAGIAKASAVPHKDKIGKVTGRRSGRSPRPSWWISTPTPSSRRCAPSKAPPAAWALKWLGEPQPQGEANEIWKMTRRCRTAEEPDDTCPH